MSPKTNHPSQSPHLKHICIYTTTTTAAYKNNNTINNNNKKKITTTKTKLNKTAKTQKKSVLNTKIPKLRSTISHPSIARIRTHTQAHTQMDVHTLSTNSHS